MLRLFFKIGISITLIGCLTYKVDWKMVWNAVRNMDLFYYGLSMGIAAASPLLAACKYRLFIKNTPLSLSIPRLVAINLSSRFYALLAPSAASVEAVRWYKVTKNKQGRSFFLASTIVERIFFLFILLVFGTIPLFFYTRNPGITGLRTALLPFLLAAAAVLLLLFSFFLFPGIQESAANLVRTRLSRQKDSKINRFLDNFAIKPSLASIFLPLLTLSLFWQILYIFRMFCLFKALYLPLNLIDAAWMASLVLLLQALPLSIAGLGVREGAYAYLFTLFALPAEKGLLTGILFFTQMLFLAAAGGTLELAEK